jgi:hypothetical protein
MSCHRATRDHFGDDGLDAVIRWTLHDAVAAAEPSPHVWECIQQRVKREAEAASVPAWHEALLGALLRHLPNLYLLLRQPGELPQNSWHSVIRARVLAEARAYNGWDLRFC